MCSAAGSSQHRRSRDGSVSAPTQRLPQSLHSSGRSAWAAVEDPRGSASFMCYPKCMETLTGKVNNCSFFIHSLQTSIWKWNGNSPVGVSYVLKKSVVNIEYLYTHYSLSETGHTSRSYRKNNIPSFESYCFPCVNTFFSIVGHSYAVASQSLFCPGFVQVMCVASGKVAPACEWMPLC